MDFKDSGEIAIEKGKFKKIKCHKFQCKPIKRQLMVHEDVDKKGMATVSDVITGYRLFELPVKAKVVTPDHIKVELKKFIAHYTKEGIAREFQRIENVVRELREK